MAEFYWFVLARFSFQILKGERLEAEELLQFLHADLVQKLHKVVHPPELYGMHCSIGPQIDRFKLQVLLGALLLGALYWELFRHKEISSWIWA